MAKVKQLLKLDVRPLNKKDTYYGFSLKDNPLFLMPDYSVHHNSGKSVMEQSIIAHTSKYSDYFQVVGVDVKRVEFNLLLGVKSVKGVALDVSTAAATATDFQQIMMSRFKFMETQQVNNVYKIKDVEVDYYTVFGKSYQFDEIFELTFDLTLDPSSREYEKLIKSYPDGRMQKITTIENIYKYLHSGKIPGIGRGEDIVIKNPSLPEVKGYNKYINKDSIRKTRGTYKPKVLLFLADELNELMTADDYSSVEAVKSALGSIARLGRAAAVHLALACQRASGSTISSDLMNNIGMKCLLGDFDASSSSLMFDKDITQLSKPDIKGRGFIQSGKDIIETQTYYVDPVDCFVFDEDMKYSYVNPTFLEQKNKRKEEIDDSGFVDQFLLDDYKNIENDFEDDEDSSDEYINSRLEVLGINRSRKNNNKNRKPIIFDDDDEEFKPNISNSELDESTNDINLSIDKLEDDSKEEITSLKINLIDLEEKSNETKEEVVEFKLNL